MRSTSPYTYASPFVQSRLRDEAEMAREVEDTRALFAALSMLAARLRARIRLAFAPRPSSQPGISLP